MELESTKGPNQDRHPKEELLVTSIKKENESDQDDFFTEAPKEAEFQGRLLEPKYEDNSEETDYNYRGNMRHLLKEEHAWDSPEFVEEMDLFDGNSKSKEKATYQQRIKKPLNAFMLFIKQMRPILKDKLHFTMMASDANKLLGKLWRQLSEQERARYSEMAAVEKHLHRQQYPEYDGKLNYARSKEKRKYKWKRRADQVRRCRAMHGMINLHLWCKGCVRKKKCLVSNCDTEMSGDRQRTLDSGEEANLMVEISKCQSMYRQNKCQMWSKGCKSNTNRVNLAQPQNPKKEQHTSSYSEWLERNIKPHNKESATSLLTSELKILKERAEQCLLANQDLLLTKINQLLEKQEEDNYSDHEISGSPEGSDDELGSSRKCQMDIVDKQQDTKPYCREHISDPQPQPNIIEELRNLSCSRSNIPKMEAVDIGVLSHRLVKADHACDDSERCRGESCDAFVLQDLFTKVYSLYLKTKKNVSEMPRPPVRKKR
ncbi:uncharacterized protein LOC132702607 isoform X2 [Cylas formicarius]|uniref:uncharacterized protein LOC132702607 isoform X2 n=1 Tax=Cylas formicarius TaxID=197179 RepID=UPI002958D7E6|nr:uncharacterized protein LOC132702607 isoform X2 [Cylas formicarius]